MQPSPMSETSKFLFPNFLFCIGFSFKTASDLKCISAVFKFSDRSAPVSAPMTIPPSKMRLARPLHSCSQTRHSHRCRHSQNAPIYSQSTPQLRELGYWMPVSRRSAATIRTSALRNSFSSHFPGSGSRPHGGCKRLKGMEPVKVSVDFFRTFDFSCHIGYVLLLIRHARCPISLAIRL